MATKPANIVSLTISKEDAAALFFNRRVLESRADDEDGSLSRFKAWVKSQDARALDSTQFKLGGPDDDFVFLYYYESVRYKLRKDGTAFVSSADADNLMEAEELDMQAMVDTVLIDELCRSFARVLPTANARMGKVKFEDDEEGYHSRLVAGVMSIEE